MKRMIYRWFFLSMVLLLTFSKVVMAQPTPFIGAEYEAGISVTLAWDSVANATKYDVRILAAETGMNQTYLFGFTTDTEMLIPKPRPGHFIFQVRACNDQATDNCSGWATSDDAAYGQVNGQPMAWKVFFFVPPPTGVGIE